MTEGDIAEVCVRLSSQTAQTLEFNLEVTLTVASGTARKIQLYSILPVFVMFVALIFDLQSSEKI